MATSPQDKVPKAILYCWPQSVWSTVPRLCLEEKGYSAEEYLLRGVDLSKGENFAPSYLRINMNGTIPTLVVPTLETTGSEVGSRYRSLRDTITICEFLDQARGAHSTNTLSQRPAPALSPATIEGKALSDSIIALVHLPEVDPNFLNLAARDSAELDRKRTGIQGKMIDTRKAALQTYIAEAKSLAAAPGAGSFENKMVDFLEEKAEANERLWSLHQAQAGAEAEKAFFEASVKSWTQALPDTLSKVEDSIKGVFALGDQVSLADLHLVAWLTRIVVLAGGEPNASGLLLLEKEMGGAKLGPKTKAFWTAWVERDSFKTVLVPAHDSFESVSSSK